MYNKGCNNKVKRITCKKETLDLMILQRHFVVNLFSVRFEIYADQQKVAVLYDLSLCPKEAQHEEIKETVGEEMLKKYIKMN